MTTAPTPDDLPESVDRARTLPTFTNDTPVPYAAEPAPAASRPSVPAAPHHPARWGAKRTLLAGGLALVLGLVGAVGAAAALHARSTGDDDGFRTGQLVGPGGEGFGGQDRRHDGFPHSDPGQPLSPGGQQLSPGGQPLSPGGQPPNDDGGGGGLDT